MYLTNNFIMYLTLLIIYFLGFLFTLWVDSVVRKDSVISKSKTRYAMTMFGIWVISPICILGLIITAILALVNRKK